MCQCSTVMIVCISVPLTKVSNKCQFRTLKVIKICQSGALWVACISVRLTKVREKCQFNNQNTVKGVILIYYT